MRVTAIGASGQLGGTERVLLDLATHADELGISLRVVAPIDGPLIGALGRLQIPIDVLEAPKRLLNASQQRGHLWSAAPALLGLFRWARRLEKH